MQLSLDDFTQLIKNICSRETSFDPINWRHDNPLYGHCAIVSLLVQDYFSGEILRYSFKDIEQYRHLRSHYFNKLVNGEIIDLTKNQFKDTKFLNDLIFTARSRNEVLSNSSTKRRYEIISSKLIKQIK